MEEDDKIFRDQIETRLAHANVPQGARNILAFLFPKVEAVIKAYVPDNMDEAERRRARRISEGDFTNSYFGLDPTPVAWSRSQIDEIVAARDPAPLLRDAQRRIELAPENERARLRSIFLDALNGAFDEAHPFNVDWLRSIVDVSPYFIHHKDESQEFFGIDNSQKLRWLLRSGLEKYSGDDRFRMFETVIVGATDLTLLSEYIRTYTSDRHADSAESRSLDKGYFGSRGDDLRQQLVSRIRVVASDETIWEQADPARLLWFWWSCDKEDEVRAFTADAVHTSAGLRGLLDVSINLVRSTAGDYEHVPGYWSKIVDLQELRRRAEQMDSIESSPEDRIRARRFILALERADTSEI
jgi:hypothetical protein